MMPTASMQGAGRCKVRVSPGRIHATYHPAGPPGVSYCTVCERLVCRGLGRWWEGRR